MNNQPTTMAEMAKSIDEKRGMFEQMLGVKLNYTPQSLKKLEAKLNEMYPFVEKEEEWNALLVKKSPQMKRNSTAKKAPSEVAVVLGIYLGECIRRNIRVAKVEWSEIAEYLAETTITITSTKGELVEGASGGKYKFKPMIRVNNFLNYDRTDSLWDMYSMAMDMALGRVKVGKEKEWKQSPRGYSYRVFKEEKR